MKILKLTLVLVAFIAFTSCSEDDNGGGNDTSGDIVGTWIGTGVDYTGTSETTTMGQTVSADFVGEAFDINYTLTFSENPNNVVADGSYSIELTTTINGQSSTETVEDLEFLNDGTWERSGNTLTITAEGEPGDATIVELTDTTLVLEIVESEGISAPDFEFTTQVTAVMTFTRQ